MQQNFEMAENDRIILPGGKTLVWDAKRQRHIEQEPQPDLKTVEREDTLTSDGKTVFAQRREKKVTTTEAEAAAQWHETSARFAILLRRFSRFIFWGFVALFLKMIISVGDMFDEYAAKGVAQGIGKGIETVVNIIVWLICLGLVFIFGREWVSKPVKVAQPESNATEIKNFENLPNVTISGKIKIAPTPESDAQSILNG